MAALVAALLAAPAALASNFTVTNGNDAGSGSLRAAITSADAASDVDTIDFDPSVTTVTISSAPLAITNPVSIDGQGRVDVREDPAYTAGPLFSLGTNAGNSTLQNMTLSGPGAAGATSLVQVAVPNVTISGSTLRGARTSGVSLIGSAQHVNITRTPIYTYGTKAISFDSSGVNGGAGAPANLRVGPRRADGSLPITGSTGGGRLELFRGDPASGDSFFFDAAVNGGPFLLQSPAPLAAGDTLGATITDGASDTSELATVRVPADIVSPELYVGVATSLTTVRVQPTEPIDPASVQASDFFLNVAGVDRPVASATPTPDGAFITLTTTRAWVPGQAGFVHLTGPAALVDRSGNESAPQGDVPVGGAPGDFTPPLVRRLKLTPSKNLCMRCRRPGAHVIFDSTKDGFAYLTVFKGRRLIGSRKFIAVPGGNFIKWDGKIGGQRLRRGGYRVYVGVQDIVGNVTPGNRQPSVKITVGKH
jgi:hypothetical protein